MHVGIQPTIKLFVASIWFLGKHYKLNALREVYLATQRAPVLRHVDANGNGPRLRSLEDCHRKESIAKSHRDKSHIHGFK